MDGFHAPMKRNSADPRAYHSNISIVAQSDSQKLHRNAFRRASAVFSKLLQQPEDKESKKEDQVTDDVLSKLLSATYCQTLVLLGFVLPLAEAIVDSISPKIYQGFYIYLCSLSLIYLCWMYASLVKDRTVVNIINSYKGDEAAYNAVKRRFRGPINRYGSYYLRLGAVAFGIGSMVYSGLEFGKILDVKNHPECKNIAQALVPACKMILTIAQMQFIFLNSRNMDLCQKPIVSRFGLMHMIATNLCEWLKVIIQETKDELELSGHGKHGLKNESECRKTDIMSSLVQNASPFLFPCTIEYSLICAVIMLEMWKDVKTAAKNQLVPHKSNTVKVEMKQAQLFTVDCSNAHKGLFCGVVFLVITIICLIIHYVFSEHNEYKSAAVGVINTCEMILFVVSFLAVFFAALRLRSAMIVHKRPAMCLDTWLLLVGQIGVSLYGMFRVVKLLMSDAWIWNEIARLVQSSSQTLFVVHAWRLRSKSVQRPARQLITFLLMTNMALWLVNTFVRNRISTDDQIFQLLVPAIWTTIGKLVMPLVIFYRFHSTICFFEIWKNTYKPTKPFLVRHYQL
ncbi:otopetrin-2-like [Cimex lectularius]|uniref:Otopetrin-2 n=1 Tax=Cimex lectularius TaxID=79782 RepID=A0A8I6RPM5_CIMLE|nr:otopetrin-2-like [Cimex lectularius]